MGYKVFVYGTLKKGQPNHYLIAERLSQRTQAEKTVNDNSGKSSSEEMRYVGRAVTVDKWPLVIACRFNIPYILDCKGTGEYIEGDAYEVNEDCLTVLDALENHPHFYERDEIRVRLVRNGDGKDIPEDQRVEETFLVYFMRNFRPELLENERYADYDCYGSHGKRYVLPGQRARADCLGGEWHKEVKLSNI